MTFATITPALIVGAFAERMKFSAVVLVHSAVGDVVYFPIAHMVWYWAGPDAITDAAKAVAAAADGAADCCTANSTRRWPMQVRSSSGARSISPAALSCISTAGIAGLVGAFCIGKRLGYGIGSWRHIRSP